ncbi:MAG: type II toxin-antitoxin system VapC family toxin [Cyanobacteria bacterium J06639_1]
MKASVYLESSVISYLTARPSRDIVSAARQAITEEWWMSCRSRFEIFISVLVEVEISSGDPSAAQRRLNAVRDVLRLGVLPEAETVANALITAKAVPQNSKEDALHIGIAVANGIEYVLTWNFKHINNAEKKSAIVEVVEELGYLCPILCSPEELGA